MQFKPLLWARSFACGLACLLVVQIACAEDAVVDARQVRTEAPRETEGAQRILDRALDLIGIRYRRGGSSSATGFDCSGFVGHVFRETLGLTLPRTAQEISQTGAPVAKSELAPGDLVFFHTMRRAFSHVGIYLGGEQFVHAPRPGEKVRVTDMREGYWAQRYNGARRIEVE